MEFFWFIIIIYLIIVGLSRTEKEKRKQINGMQDKDFENLVVLQKNTYKPPQKTVKKDKEKQKVEEKIEKPILKTEKVSLANLDSQSTMKNLDLSSQDKLEEAIILSVILGPPVSYKFYCDFYNRLLRKF